MPTKVSQMTTASTPTGAETLPVVQGGENKKTTIASLFTATTAFYQDDAAKRERDPLGKMREIVSVTDFSGVIPGNGADHTTGLQSAITYSKLLAALANEVKLVWPAGDYNVTSLNGVGSSRVTWEALGGVNIYGTDAAGVSILNFDGGTTTQTNKFNIYGNFAVQIKAGGAYQYGVKISYFNNCRIALAGSGAYSVNSVHIDYSWDNPQLDFYFSNSSGTAITTVKCGTNNFNNNKMYCRVTGSSNMAVASVGMELTGSGNRLQIDASSAQIGLKLVACRGCVIGPIYTEATKHPISTSGNPAGNIIMGGDVEVGTNGSIDLSSSENTVLATMKIKGIGGGSSRTGIDMGAACYGLFTMGLRFDAATIDTTYSGTWRGDGSHTKSFNVGAFQWIAFPATQDPSSNANTLDDYEEGSCTFTVSAVVPGDLSATYTTQSGRYIKNGKNVNLTGQVVTSAFTWSTSSGQFKINGVPFTSDASAGFATGSLAFGGITKAGYTQFNSYIDPNTSFLVVKASASGSARSNVSIPDVPSGGSLVFDFSIAYSAAN